MNRTAKLVSVAGIVAVLAAAVWWRCGRTVSAPAGESVGRSSGRAARAVSPAAGRKDPSSRRHDGKAAGVSAEWTLDDFDDDDHPYSLADKRLALELQRAFDAVTDFDEDDFKPLGKNDDSSRGAVHYNAIMARDRFYAAAAAAAASPNPALRREAVEDYSWFDSAMLPELTPMMADADAEVAEAAISAVEDALEAEEDMNLRFEAAAACLGTFSANEEAMDMLCGVMVSSAQELIEPETDDGPAEARAAQNRQLVVETIARLIDQGKGNCAELMQDAYSDISAEEWLGLDEALKWARDPDDYEAPDPDDGESGGPGFGASEDVL